jgi:hypothetical protein
MANGTEYPSKWLPIIDRVALACIGKAGEESAELSAILFRTIIQGIDEIDPDTGKLNRLAIQEEIADVAATSELLIEMLDLDRPSIELRKQRKIAMKKAWFAMLREDVR